VAVVGLTTATSRSRLTSANSVTPVPHPVQSERRHVGTKRIKYRAAVALVEVRVATAVLVVAVLGASTQGQIRFPVIHAS